MTFFKALTAPKKMITAPEVMIKEDLLNGKNH